MTVLLPGLGSVDTGSDFDAAWGVGSDGCVNAVSFSAVTVVTSGSLSGTGVSAEIKSAAFLLTEPNSGVYGGDQRLGG